MMVTDDAAATTALLLLLLLLLLESRGYPEAIAIIYNGSLFGICLLYCSFYYELPNYPDIPPHHDALPEPIPARYCNRADVSSWDTTADHCMSTVCVTFFCSVYEW